MQNRHHSLLSTLWICCLAPAYAALDADAARLGSAPIACSAHRDALVAHMQEDARLHDHALRVQRLANGVIVLEYADYSQRIRCLDGVLHIDFVD
jgi:hypothetical protein